MNKNIQTRQLECKVTEMEASDRSKELARLVRELREDADHQARVKKEWSQKKNEKQARIEHLARIVHTRREAREVECAEMKDFETRTVRLIRADTGETVESRPMRREELQLELKNRGEDLN